MSTPTNPKRLLNILIGRHRRLGNVTYKKLLKEFDTEKPNNDLRVFYRGLVNDIISLIKEVREQEIHSKRLEYGEVLDEIDAFEGETFKEKVDRWVKNVERG